MTTHRTPGRSGISAQFLSLPFGGNFPGAAVPGLLGSGTLHAMEAKIGKRSTFERVERDFYRTPPEAVAPLVPHLPADFTYWEPCAGDGALIDALWAVGGQNEPYCALASDLVPQRNDILTIDALTVPRQHVVSEWKCNFIITNPPWTRQILHPMIEHFSAMRPTWLLFDADWMHTKQSAPFMGWCRKVVSVGRVKWIPDSKHTGKDNCAWYLFDQNSTGPTVFVGRQE